MNKIKKNDTVIAISGRDRQKIGKVLAVLQNGRMLIVEGINVVKKHIKANPNNNEPGDVVLREIPILACKVQLYDFSRQQASRVGIRQSVIEEGQVIKKYRYFKDSDQKVPDKSTSAEV